MTRLSAADFETVQEVAFACSTDLPLLGYVWVGCGWAIGTDTYRLDARAIDSAAAGLVNPWGPDRRLLAHLPVPPGGPVAPPNAWRLIDDRIAGSAAAVTVHEAPEAPNGWEWPRWCAGCRTTGPHRAGPWDCCPHFPLLDPRYIADLLAHADRHPVVLRWDWDNPGGTVRFAEDDHIHLIMPARRPG